ncbi:MAG: D-tyrosyl-tRNA(Tyr) deacylase [Acidobacteria bacterium]|nr:MAG: D-tyrosyl-tRNA(Tyr) deacylase [Acidobacteriota bacterium]REK00088.1 MAG: D-tyrosyl-tRNA(Tyr) deacylase [Acidobacteriota bacterium]
MRLVLQRVKRAEVRIDGAVVGSIGLGLVALVGVERGDDESNARGACARIVELRIFEDERGRMNRSLEEIGGSVLVVSQFTLAASLAKGRRPSLHTAADGDQAKSLYLELLDSLRRRLGEERVAAGRFAASMEVELVNAGPVTFVLEA